MKRPSQRSLQKATPILVLAAALLIYAPTAFGLSGGASKDTVADPHWADYGCTACHGPGSSAPHDFADTGIDPVTVTIVDAKPNRPTMEQMSRRPGLDMLRSKSLRGMDLHGIAYDASGTPVGTNTPTWITRPGALHSG